MLKCVAVFLTYLIAIGCIVFNPPAAVSDTPRPYFEPDPLAYVAPNRNFDTVHIRLNLDLDLKNQSIAGEVTHTIKTLKPNQESIHLNCVGLTVEEVLVNGNAVEFDYPSAGTHDTSWIDAVDVGGSSDELVIHFGEAVKRGTPLEITVRYHGSPKEGLYFVAPEKGIADKRYEVWSQGEGEDNRYWIPCFDYPNDKATFEGIFRVDKGYYCLSNGVLVSQRDVGEKTEFYWGLDTPQVTYLIMVAAGKYEIVEEKWRNVSLMYLAPPGTSHDTIMRGYGKTVDMMEFFSDVIGIDYPFKKYAQVTVQNFIYGGMENTTATVMNMRMLFDERMQLTKNEDDLVAHELAHQWWGDMVTCREWAHLWLNEGFATYFQQLYRAHDEGDDAFRYEMDERHRKVFAKDKVKSLPMVVDFFNRDGKRNSNNVYVKGASVLHMLRFLIGDELFYEVFKTFGEEYKYKLAGTEDFIRVVRETTGENLDWFFEQWVYMAGHPKLKVAKTWSPSTKTLKVSISQTQDIAKLTPAFRLPMDLEITCKESTETYRVVIDKQTQEFYFQLPSNPLMVIIDKGDWTLKTVDFPKTTAELVYQLEHGDIMDRVYAARALSKKHHDAAASTALRKVLIGDDFWGVRRDAALSLGKMRDSEALLDVASIDNARVRLGVAEALGRVESSKKVDAVLLSLLRDDPAYEVNAAAVAGLVKIRSKHAEKACLEALKMKSDEGVIRRAGLNGLAEMEATHLLDKVRAMAVPGNDRRYRHDAITAYAKIAEKLEKEKDREAAARFLAGMLDDWYVKTRATVITSLKTLGDPHAIEALQLAASSDPVQYIRGRASGAIAAIEARDDQLSDKTEKLNAEIRSLSEKISILQKDLRALQTKVPEQASDSEQLSRKASGEE